jgi:CHAT domain-containing protein/Flp pilus assembly protein TadD
VGGICADGITSISKILIVMRILKLLAGIIISFLYLNSTISQDFDPEFTKALEYYETGQNKKAALEFESAIPYVEQENGPYDTTLLTPLLILTGVCYELDLQYQKAENYYLRVKSIFETINATNDYGYAVSLNNLAQLYDGMGRYLEAERFYLQAIEIEKIAIGEDNEESANTISNLASLYYTMGRYEQAESLYKQSLIIFKSTLGENHPRYALTLNNLALAYVALKLYNNADSLFKQTLDIAKFHLGETHSQYALYLSNYGQMYYIMGHYKQAEPLFKEAEKIAKEQLDENHPSYAIKLNNLASLYVEMGRYEEAESLFMLAIGIHKKQLGENHIESAKVLNNLAELYLITGNYMQVVNLHKQAFQAYKYQINTNSGFLSEQELKQFLNTFLYHLEIYQSFNSRQIHSQIATGDFAYNIELTRKEILLKSSLGVKNRILESGDSSLVNSYLDLRSLRKKIDKLKMKAPEEQGEDPVELEAQANELEKILTLKSKDYQKAQQENEITWKDVKQNLKPGEVAIEFASFNYYNGKKSTDSILYCAVVLRSTDTIPHIIYLCEESRLKKIIPLSTATPRKINFAYNSEYGKGQSLYDLIWRPIDSVLNGIETIYYAPSGMLNSVSMSAILSPDNKALMDKYNLVQLSTTRTLALPKEPELINDAIVYGGIIYDTDTTTLLNTAEKYMKDESDLLACNRSYTGNNRGGFRYLEGTQKEADMISAKLKKKNITTTTYSGTEALEESFLALSGKNSPSVIHLATHGFYFPDTISEKNRKNIMFSSKGEVRFRYSDDPLLRSGLLMAGANLAWKGQPIPAHVEDGILTAKEVSNMNLMNTELIVLSACQSGQGDVKGSEGVEGLQRGFKMAGVRYIIMSLWQVPDKETTEFMETFYDNWLEGNDIHKAFRDTQISMKNKYRDDPFKWAGFVLME